MGNYYFGIAGWSYPDWKGIVYPPDAPRKFDELSYIATYFDSVELNNTFYRIPESKVVESWVRRVAHNPRFRFTAKLWQGFTHEKKPLSSEEIEQYLRALKPMYDHLGALLAQFPASFKNEDSSQKKLEELISYFPGYPLVVEFRHRSWSNSQVVEWLEEHQIGFCNVDEPAFRDMIKPSAIVTGPVAYVRFHGRNYQNWYSKQATRDTRYDYLYSEEELDQWIPRIEEMGKKAKDTYVIANNHFRGQAPANVLQLKSKTIRKPVEVPDPMLDSFPQLKKVAIKKQRNRKQQSLFDS